MNRRTPLFLVFMLYGMSIIAQNANNANNANKHNTNYTNYVTGASMKSTNNRYQVYITSSIGLCSLLFLFFRFSSKKQTEGRTLVPKFQVIKGSQFSYDNGSDEVFENYVASLFDPQRFRVSRIEKDKAAEKNIFDKSHKYPDIEVEYLPEHGEGDKFAIECKWCADFSMFENIRGIKWADNSQIKNYCQYEKKEKIPVWIAVGLEGTPGKPAQIFLARLTELKDSFIPEDQLDRYKITKLSSKFSYNPYTKRVINQ